MQPPWLWDLNGHFCKQVLSAKTAHSVYRNIHSNMIKMSLPHRRIWAARATLLSKYHKKRRWVCPGSHLPLFMLSCPHLSERQSSNLQAHNTRIRSFLCDVQGWFSLEAEKTGGETHWVLRAVPQPCAVKGNGSTALNRKGRQRGEENLPLVCLYAGLLPNDNYKQNTSLCKTA